MQDFKQKMRTLKKPAVFLAIFLCLILILSAFTNGTPRHTARENKQGRLCYAACVCRCSVVIMRG